VDRERRSDGPGRRVKSRAPLRAFGAALLTLWFGVAQAAGLTVFCAGAMKAPVSAIVGARVPNASPIEIVYGTAGALRDRIAKGERPDVLVVPSQDMAVLVTDRVVDAATRTALGSTGVGVAVRADAPSPDISTPAALTATLLAARRIVMVDPTKGTSGRIVDAVFKELGIADAMRDKTLELDGGYVVEAVARGEADVGLHQVTEILPVAGVKLVGPLPGDLNRLTRYDAAIVATTTHRAEADALMGALTNDDARRRIEAAGFTPAR